MFSYTMKHIFGATLETEVHPHVAEEKADLFHAINSASTELETLNLLNALIYAYKPHVVLETGTYLGYGTIAIASALKTNGFGKVHTIERHSYLTREACANIKRYDPDLLDYIEMHIGESAIWLTEYEGKSFDFAFFDSELANRHIEFQIIESRNLFSSGALAMFHDTSRLRGNGFDDFNVELLSALDEFSEGRQWIESGLSRGFRLIKLS
jgi:predicted O-methyltransferase YrrM